MRDWLSLPFPTTIIGDHAALRHHPSAGFTAVRMDRIVAPALCYGTMHPIYFRGGACSLARHSQVAQMKEGASIALGGNGARVPQGATNSADGLRARQCAHPTHQW